MAKLSRRKLAQYVADQLLEGNVSVIRELAAFLVDDRRTKEAELVIRDIESALARRGVVIADVESAHELSKDARDAIVSFVKATTTASQVELGTSVDESLIGGFRLTVPGGVLDTTVKHSLDIIKTSKV